jgi:hypothetical protein
LETVNRKGQKMSHTSNKQAYYQWQSTITKERLLKVKNIIYGIMIEPKNKEVAKDKTPSTIRRPKPKRKPAPENTPEAVYERRINEFPNAWLNSRL